MGCEGGFVHVRLVHLNLPVSSVAVDCSKYRSVSEGIDEFVHPGSTIRVPTGKLVQPTVVHAEVKVSILYRNKNHGLARSKLGGSNTPS